jgi:hypothetical protein
MLVSSKKVYITACAAIPQISTIKIATASRNKEFYIITSRLKNNVQGGSVISGTLSNLHHGIPIHLYK